MTARVSNYMAMIRSFNVNCYGGSKQIPLVEIYPHARKGDHLEIDLIGFYGKTGLLIEVTDLNKQNKKKIKRFLRHCGLFINSPISLAKRLKFFSDFPKSRLIEIKSVNEWKYIYFGESFELIEEKIRASDFPEGRERLVIFNSDDIAYLRLLSKVVRTYAKYEFLSALGFRPSDFGKAHILEKQFLKVEDRLLSRKSQVRADIYLLEFSPDELLTIGRVFRYGGVLFPLEVLSRSSEGRGFQRILIQEKINDMATEHIRDNVSICFPNTVTLLLSEECHESKKGNETVLQIPLRYASIDIIDGQHRIFAYGHESISKHTRENATILASAIRLKTDREKDRSTLAARTFWLINSRQAVAKRDLLYLIQYNVLGDKEPLALAGAVVCRCNDTKGALFNLLKTNPLRKRNRFKEPPIRITTIVEELGRLMDISEMDDSTSEGINVTKIFGKPPSELSSRDKDLVNGFSKLLNEYFNKVADVFNEDWKKGSGSNIMCTNYIAAFVRLLRYFIVEKGYSSGEIANALGKIKNNARVLLGAAVGSPTFPSTIEATPPKRYGAPKICDFLMQRLA